MLIFVPDQESNKTAIDFCIKNNIGLLYTSDRPQTPRSNLFIVDNGAFRAFRTNIPWDEVAFYKYLEKLDGKNPYFVVVPDIVAAGMESYNHSLKHLEKIPFKKYFAVQDGMYPDAVYHAVAASDGIFIGGSLLWKWRTAHTWIEYAHDLGLKCHIGRVGSYRGYERANQLEADSVDGSNPIRNRKLEMILKWREQSPNQKRIITHIEQEEEWLASVHAAGSKR